MQATSVSRDIGTFHFCEQQARSPRTVSTAPSSSARSALLQSRSRNAWHRLEQGGPRCRQWTHVLQESPLQANAPDCAKVPSPTETTDGDERVRRCGAHSQTESTARMASPGSFRCCRQHCQSLRWSSLMTLTWERRFEIGLESRKKHQDLWSLEACLRHKGRCG